MSISTLFVVSQLFGGLHASSASLFGRDEDMQKSLSLSMSMMLNTKYRTSFAQKEGGGLLLTSLNAKADKATKASKTSKASKSGKSGKSSSSTPTPPPSGSGGETPEPTQPPSGPTPTPPPVTPGPTNPPTGTLPDGLEFAPNCFGDPDFDYICLRNSDYGVQDESRYDVDLSLEIVNIAHAAAYVSAREKWMSIIIGDIDQEVPGSALESQNGCNDPFPDMVDDLRICGRDVLIDGPGNILGSAFVTWIWQGETITSIAGEMEFDIPDIEFLIEENIWEAVILHEMGHIEGIGTLWYDNNLVICEDIESDPTCRESTGHEYLGERAIDVWQNDWGCVDTPPVEDEFAPGTRGGHWDEGCLVNEGMTGFIDEGNNPFSKLTIASMEDMGYVVDYDAADDYDGSDTTCCIDPNAAPAPPSKPPLSDAGRAKAVDYGQKLLKDRAPTPEQVAYMNENKDLIYVGDKIVNVLFEENGYIYEVLVVAEDLNMKPGKLDKKDFPGPGTVKKKFPGSKPFH